MTMAPHKAGEATVSVCMITYNHAQFVEQAVMSVIEQVADFKVDLIIGDDASTDDTPEILQRLRDQFPERIKLELRKSNVGMMENFSSTLGRCNGKYIALLEGDDYWSDSSKLARQVAYLENNADFALCFHPVAVSEGGKTVADRFTLPVPEVTSITDLARGNYMHTCSVMYRNGLVKELPSDFARSTVGDYFLHMLYARGGPIGRLPETMAVYRVHAGGVWSSHKNIERKVLQYLDCMIGHFDDQIDAILKERYRKISARVFFALPPDSDRRAQLHDALKYGEDEFLKSLNALQTEHFASQNKPWKRFRSAVKYRLKNALS